MSEEREEGRKQRNRKRMRDSEIVVVSSGKNKRRK
jgi:hypothetical protein